MYNHSSIRIAGLTLFWLLIVAGDNLTAQKDTVYKQSETNGRNSLVRGKVVETTAFKVVVEDNGNRRDVPAAKINKIVFSGEPRTLGRATDHFDNQRWDDCLDALSKLEDVPDSRFIQQKIAFMRAYASAAKALRGDQNTSVSSAQEQLGEFIKSNSTSYQLVVAIDLYGQLLMANGEMAAALKEFNKLTKSRWDRYVTRGHFFEGEIYIHQQNYDAARQSYQALKAMEASDPETRKFQLLADCQLAKINAMQGNPEQGIETLLRIIRDENPDDTRLFAIAYNALGTCYQNSGQIKKACRAFLHTELLFSSEADAHAEALYHLSQIWPQLKETDRANRAREMLTTRYRNTIWASKL